MGNKKVRAHVFISGKVQGVFYRAWTRKTATSFDLTGWVRNLSDDRVEAVFEGEKENIEKMIKKCKEGSKVASVSHMDVNWEEATGELGGFEILPTS